MKIFVISDIHMSYTKMYKNVPANIDYLIIAGDMLCRGNREEANEFLTFLTNFKQEKKIGTIYAVCGNHDISLIKSTEKYQDKYPDINIVVLGTYDIGGYKVFMSSWSAYNGYRWANGFETIEQEKEVMLPKEDVDIIVTHGPMSHKSLSMLKFQGGVNIGSDKLREYVELNDKVKYVFNGHAHMIDIVSETGECIIGNTFCKNVSEKGYLLEL